MKTIKVTILLSCLTLLTCNSVSETQTPPEAPKNDKIYIADPFILLHKGTYYAYGTSRDDGFEVYVSQDLNNWKKHTDLALSQADSYGEKWFWAPEVYYNSESKTFYMYYSAEEHICVAISESPLGPFKQVERKPMRAEKAIDSSLFIDDDGTPYLFFVRFINGLTIWVAQLESDLTTIKENTLKKCLEATSDWELQQDRVTEGPSVFKYNGIYYLLYSANNYQSRDYAVGYATASSPMGTWSKSTDNPVLHKPGMKLVGTGHGSIFFDKNGNFKYVFHSHFSTTKVHPRQMNITDMAIDDNAKLTISSSKIISSFSLK